ncbi:hypothetical protein [Endozoicomonas sp. 4G]|uniref:hypothetical protein n=1 Tax=Endozoicomonas sp. 4G TaxID=2872754 RepID=UPI002078B6F2|nr:hypothetical protein [Endozoicomonas sp. 4G]
MIHQGLPETAAVGQFPSSQFAPSEQGGASLSGKGVAIAEYSNEGSHIPQEYNSYESRPLKARKASRALATLSAIAMGVASAFYVIPTGISVGALAAGSVGAMIGSIAGAQGFLAGAVAGATVGSFMGLGVTAYYTPYLMAKTYNAILAATNDNGFERSKLADRIVSYYEGAAPTSKA